MENQISMNSIKALKDFVTKQSDEFKSEPDPYSAPAQPDSALDVPDITDINTGEPEDFDDGNADEQNDMMADMWDAQYD